MIATAAEFVQRALSRNGCAYVFGAEVKLDDPAPEVFDCAELVEWACAQVGVKIPDGSANQLAWCQKHGTMLDVESALRVEGALLFRPGHVAISLGDGRTIEAKGKDYGVGVFNARNRFTSGAYVPGLTYDTPEPYEPDSGSSIRA